MKCNKKTKIISLGNILTCAYSVRMGTQEGNRPGPRYFLSTVLGKGDEKHILDPLILLEIRHILLKLVVILKVLITVIKALLGLIEILLRVLGTR